MSFDPVLANVSISISSIAPFFDNKGGGAAFAAAAAAAFAIACLSAGRADLYSPDWPNGPPNGGKTSR